MALKTMSFRCRSTLTVVLALLLLLVGVWQGVVQHFSVDVRLSSCLTSRWNPVAAHSRFALAGAWTTAVPFDSAALIPLQLWQTSGSKQLRGRAQQLHDSWTRLNPSLNTTLMDDAEAAAFIRSFFGRHTHAVYAAYPLNVMRADFWRYAVLYAYGGVYADIDTECLQPIKQWFPPRTKRAEDPAFVVDAPTWQAAGPLQYLNMTWDNCSLVAGLENDAHICQWIIAAAPRHPILRAAVQTALRSLEKGVNCTAPHVVHEHTVPSIWTRAFKQVLALPDFFSAADIARAVWMDPTVYQRARELGVCVVAPTFWGAPGNSTAQNARNHYSSQWLEQHPNTPWVKDREQIGHRNCPAARSQAQHNEGVIHWLPAWMSRHRDTSG